MKRDANRTLCAGRQSRASSDLQSNDARDATRHSPWNPDHSVRPKPYRLHGVLPWLLLASWGLATALYIATPLDLGPMWLLVGSWIVTTAIFTKSRQCAFGPAMKLGWIIVLAAAFHEIRQSSPIWKWDWLPEATGIPTLLFQAWIITCSTLTELVAAAHALVFVAPLLWLLSSQKLLNSVLVSLPGVASLVTSAVETQAIFLQALYAVQAVLLPLACWSVLSWLGPRPSRPTPSPPQTNAPLTEAA